MKKFYIRIHGISWDDNEIIEDILRSGYSRILGVKEYPYVDVEIVATSPNMILDIDYHFSFLTGLLHELGVPEEDIMLDARCCGTPYKF